MTRLETLVDRRRADATRGFLAIAAAMIVMLAGAGFLGVSMNRAPADGPSPPPSQRTSSPAPAARVISTPLPEPAPGSLATAIAPTAAAAPTTIATEIETPPADPVPSPPAETPDANDAPSVDVQGGIIPRLNPLRARRGSVEPQVDTTLDPRVKPLQQQGAATVGAERLVALGQQLRASDEEGPAPFFFADETTGPTLARRPLAVAYAGDIEDDPRAVKVALAKGETFVDALRRAGVRAEDRNAATYAFGAHYNLRSLRPGQEFAITAAAPNQTIFQIVAEGHEPQSFLLALDFRPDPQTRIILKRAQDGGFDAKKSTVALTTRLASISGRIDGSLYNSAKRVGSPDKVVADLAGIFAYDVDFQREIFGGDEFEAVFEARYDENGRLVEAGDILYGRLKWRGRTKEKGYYRFASRDGGATADYFDRAGEGAKRLLMKTPIDGARLSSGFGTRRHPIKGYQKAHKGVDFAAPRGTPIKAAGDGVVERADRYGGYGNYIRIRHNKGYKTAYGHLSGFVKGMRSGKRVDQGDIIGYVGSTGQSTGPHLHYEVLLEGTHINPQKLKIATGVSLSGAELQRFKAARDRLDAMRAPESEATPLLAQDDKGNQL